MSSTTDVPPAKPLKRLGFVKDTAEYIGSYTTVAESLYKKAKEFVPSSLQPTIDKSEEAVLSVAVPLVTKATDIGAAALYLADDKVDLVLNTGNKTIVAGKNGVSKTYETVSQLHANNVKTFSETSAAYYSAVQSFADWAKDKLNPVKGGQAALDALNSAMAKAQEATDPDVAVKMATDAWAAFASVPVVARLLETADPVTRTALTSFYKLHDALVSLGLYKRAVDTGASTLTWAISTTPYKLGAQYVYPLVQPVADPALEKISNSKVVKEALDYWKPAIAA